MICPKCTTVNDDDNIFCINCGTTISANAAPDIPPPTVLYQGSPKQQSDSSHSIKTAYIPQTNNNPPVSGTGGTTAKKSGKKFIWIGLILGICLLIGIAGGAIFLIQRQAQNAEILPEHLGMFVQNGEKNAVSEIVRQDFSNALEAKDNLIKTEMLPLTDSKANLILYSDGKDIPLSDLKLIKLDTITDDGSLKQINFQAAPVEGKPEMKRLRVPNGLAGGKYAFALFEGYLNEGKHKFWAFQVQNAEKSDNGDLAKAIMVPLKPTPMPTASPQNNSNPSVNTVIETPVDKPKSATPGGFAYSRTDNVVLRGAPSLTAEKVDGLYRGQRLYIISESDNYTSWRGARGNWVYVETDDGTRGWVFSPLIRY